MLSSPVMAGSVRDGVWTLPCVASEGTNTHPDQLAKRFTPTANCETYDVCDLASSDVGAVVPPIAGVIGPRSGHSSPLAGRSD